MISSTSSKKSAAGRADEAGRADPNACPQRQRSGLTAGKPISHGALWLCQPLCLRAGTMMLRVIPAPLVELVLGLGEPHREHQRSGVFAGVLVLMGNKDFSVERPFPVISVYFLGQGGEHASLNFIVKPSAWTSPSRDIPLLSSARAHSEKRARRSLARVALQIKQGKTEQQVMGLTHFINFSDSI